MTHLSEKIKRLESSYASSSKFALYIKQDLPDSSKIASTDVSVCSNDSGRTTRYRVHPELHAELTGLLDESARLHGIDAEVALDKLRTLTKVADAL